MRGWAGGIALAAGLALAQPAAAQEDDGRPNALREGAYALSFGIPEGGQGELGIWKMVSERTGLGLEVGLGASRTELDRAPGEQTSTRWEVAAGLAARRYLATTRAVAPFLTGRLSAAYLEGRSDSPGIDTEHSAWRTALSGGLGVEWFPARSVSVGGHTGAALSYGRTSAVRPLPSGEPSPGDATATGVFFHTFTSGLSFRIYF